ncbi:MAG TPA: SET domain-containing protein-lysine N-methyltransferase [Steroidobacteraceae bacterium]|nr:SET domain-containing protein-lysine N-methyltransferase [Steroidobacteraceae bacterium]
MASSQVEPDLTTSELIEVRRSNVHGLGVFAAQRIPKGTRIIEYVGERVSHDEADRRYEEKDANDSHTFLFIVDSKTVIDAGVDGNDARFFNHSCDPNCESTVAKRRVYIEALRDIEAGAELTYDYQIQREDDDPDNIDDVFACRCGFPQCRGTMLWPTERKAKRKKPKKKARTSAKTKAKTQAKTRTKTKNAKTATTATRKKTKTAARNKRTALKKKSKRGGRSR